MENSIISLRNVQSAAHFEVVYEWEDDIAQYFNWKIKRLGFIRYKVLGKIREIFPIWRLSVGKGKRNLFFCMDVYELKRFSFVWGVYPSF